ncbi:hypothetical protein [Neorhizobium galegae]|uniref:hypothetical protein n=1 Tax=Neorhizobium galegae TaxID=399 RepID=UPI0012D6604F|nr:hypothetical protein [Neorhizobium galegae]KAB1123280.1 hypothetical protein F4V90_16915 [Neorhizobium galegae]MCQ1807166.1 hypothetical protein [Neorhizobium galegae]UIK05215.1 hypothetical protein LZK81_21600 [Neorhizobium galegae]
MTTLENFGSDRSTIRIIYGARFHDLGDLPAANDRADAPLVGGAGLIAIFGEGLGRKVRALRDGG